ncbi:hypothetical protein HLB42_21680 (plasmid) [Deinococcus sp. D7000]|nr:hypothetical protein HLB42_13955 [Deinococcus sp. D7000]QLG13553.1 hypothetical protein HLB42_21680 [Deinococcus sp. D7000]
MIAAWCAHCGDPYPVRLPECPECLTAQLLTPIPTSTRAAALTVSGERGVLIVRRGLVEQDAVTWAAPRQSCDCTDCGRNQPLIGCPDCGGTGQA